MFVNLLEVIANMNVMYEKHLIYRVTIVFVNL